MKHTDIRINPLLYIVWTIFIISKQTSSLLLTFLGAVLHESAHICAFTLYGAEIGRLEILPFGISVTLKDASRLSCKQEIVCAAAGPLTNLICAILIVFFKKLPNLAGTDFFFYCNIALFTINCLPVIPLDGGRILYFGLLQRTSITTAKRISTIVSFLVLIPLFIYAFTLAFRDGNISVLIIGLYLLIYLFISPDAF